ncbi:beta-defensin 129 [Castor canadensis]|uniref:Beta-defensin 129 n=1 Tax=Castor canadensis TaxID=51338 RepID=A0A8B7WIW7_CASCN|nr:beta-defensin 129 [Castor canadensis]
MKLIFPVFASLVLQYQVNSEFLVLKRCLMGFGKCKGSCRADEKEIQMCKKKKCCVGPKVTQLIKSYLRHELPRIPDSDLIEMLKKTKNFSISVQRKYMLPALPKIESTSPFLNTNSVITPNGSPVKSNTSSTRLPSHITHTATFIKSNTKQSRDSSSAPSPPP